MNVNPGIIITVDRVNDYHIRDVKPLTGVMGRVHALVGKLRGDTVVRAEGRYYLVSQKAIEAAVLEKEPEMKSAIHDVKYGSDVKKEKQKELKTTMKQIQAAAQYKRNVVVSKGPSVRAEDELELSLEGSKKVGKKEPTLTEKFDAIEKQLQNDRTSDEEFRRRANLPPPEA